MNHLNNHNLLKELNKVYYNSGDLHKDTFLQTLSQSLSFNYLKQTLGISEKKLDESIQFLVINRNIDEHCRNSEKNHLNYKLNEKGRNSLINMYYYNKLWFKDKKFIINLIITLLISILSVIITNYSSH